MPNKRVNDFSRARGGTFSNAVTDAAADEGSPSGDFAEKEAVFEGEPFDEAQEIQEDEALEGAEAIEGDAPSSDLPSRGAAYLDSGFAEKSGNSARLFHRPAKPKVVKASKKGLVAAIAVVALLAVLVCIFVVRPRLQGSGAAGQSVTVTVEQGQSTSQIADALEQAGVVDSASAFVSYVTEQGAESSLKPGEYMMTTGCEYSEVLAQLMGGTGTTDVALTVPEGYTLSQTAQIVEQTCGLSADEFTELASNASAYVSDYPFLEGAYNNSLEGFLFPKTYSVPSGAGCDEVIRMMLDQYQIEVATLDYSGARGLSAYEVLCMASCVEREALNDEDRAHIAGVLYNRLDAGMPLGLDVTVSYALGKSGEELSSQDLQTDSPYNTYVNQGLPPGPICSPGLASLEAVCNPLETSDYYFILTSDYSHFYETYDEFLVGKEEYQAGN